MDNELNSAIDSILDGGNDDLRKMFDATIKQNKPILENIVERKKKPKLVLCKKDSSPIKTWLVETQTVRDICSLINTSENKDGDYYLVYEAGKAEGSYPVTENELSLIIKKLPNPFTEY